MTDPLFYRARERWVASGSVEGGSSEVMAASKEAKARREKEDSKVDEITKQCVAELTSKTEAKRGIVPEFVLRLTEDGDVTPDGGCSSAEVARRRAIQSTRLRARLTIPMLTSSNLDACTEYATPVFPGYHLDFRHVFELSVLHEPADAKLDLLMSQPGSWLADTLLASVAVPLPGQLEPGTAAASSSRRRQPVASCFAPVSMTCSFDSSGLFVVASSMLGSQVCGINHNIRSY